MNSQKRDPLRAIEGSLALALEIPKLQMACAWVSTPRQNLCVRALVLCPSPGIRSWLLSEIGYLVGPDVAVLAALKLPPDSP